MRFTGYSKYKPSGIEWLGDVPDQWDAKSLRYVCRFAYGDSLAAEDREDGSVEVFGSNGAVGSHITANTQEPVIVVGRKGSHGKVNFSEKKVFAIDTTYFVDRNQTQAHLRWVYYALATVGLDAVSKDSAVPGLAREDAYAHYVATPPMDEQRAIANFLDRETAKLDTLVEKKRALIEKLKEKRAALISRTVTRGLPPAAARAAGLNPHPKLKPTGVEWIGDVPEHWEIKRLKFQLVKIEQGWSPQCDNTPADEGEWGVLKAGAVNGIEFDPTENKRLPEAETPLREFEIKTGDFLISRANTRALLGSAALVRKVQPQLLLCDKLYRLTIQKRRLNSEFLLRFMRSTPGHYEFERDASGSSASMQNIGQESVRNLWIPVPPFSEQSAITNYLDHEITKIDRLVEKGEAAIERLREYRTALITAAVTGKIDVRGAAT